MFFELLQGKIMAELISKYAKFSFEITICQYLEGEK